MGDGEKGRWGDYLFLPFPHSPFLDIQKTNATRKNNIFTYRIKHSHNEKTRYSHRRWYEL